MSRLLQYVVLLCFVGFLNNCKNRNTQENRLLAVHPTETKVNSIAPLQSEVIAQSVIYEANIRQYSAEGTFSAFTKDLQKLKDLGVKILWLMPIYPISKTKSKGKLGSYYAISDYTKVNPEFGTLQDFRDLVTEAHKLGIYVILDWVANHTGWDHDWIQSHPDYYSQNAKGEIIHPVDTDWTDVADLNYENKSLRLAMQQAMTYWVKDMHVDGFRCDVAAMVPTDFWENTITKLRKHKPLFMLAEAWEPKLLHKAFDMAYSWDTHHVMNAIAQGKADASTWRKRMKQIDSLYQKDAILMNFTSNHDENSWNGTVTERMGAAKTLFAALSYLSPGMPLLYSGQEYDLNKRLRFFDKDTIPKIKGEFFTIYQKLGKLKNTNPALSAANKQKARYLDITNSNPKQILIFERAKEENKIIFVGNMSKAQQKFISPITGEYTDYMTGNTYAFTKQKSLSLHPWEFWILVPKTE